MISKNAFMSSSVGGTVVRTIVHTIGHFIIAAACVMYFTGASFDAAITNAIVEPLLNSVWYFVLDKCWNSKLDHQKSIKE